MLKSITWTFNQGNKTGDGLKKREPFWNVLFCSCLTALPLPSLLCFCSASYLTSCANLSQTVNQCSEEHLSVSLKRPSLSDDAAEDFAVAALNKQFEFFPLFLCKHAAEDPVSSVGCCPHRSNNHQQPTAGLFILPFPVLAILGMPPFFCPIYRGWWDASVSWCWFILKLLIVPLFKYKSIMC